MIWLVLSHMALSTVLVNRLAHQLLAAQRKRLGRSRTRGRLSPRQNSESTELHPFNNVTGLMLKLLISKSVIILARDN
jgi:hypothetical protein